MPVSVFNLKLITLIWWLHHSCFGIKFIAHWQDLLLHTQKKPKPNPETHNYRQYANTISIKTLLCPWHISLYSFYGGHTLVSDCFGTQVEVPPEISGSKLHLRRSKEKPFLSHLSPLPLTDALNIQENVKIMAKHVKKAKYYSYVYLDAKYKSH